MKKSREICNGQAQATAQSARAKLGPLEQTRPLHGEEQAREPSRSSEQASGTDRTSLTLASLGSLD